MKLKLYNLPFGVVDRGLGMRATLLYNLVNLLTLNWFGTAGIT